MNVMFYREDSVQAELRLGCMDWVRKQVELWILKILFRMLLMTLQL